MRFTLAYSNGVVYLASPVKGLVALNASNGKKIWETDLPYSGSAPPMAFRYKGCDVIVFTSTGGRFVGYQKNGDTTIAYKLKNCNFN